MGQEVGVSGALCLGHLTSIHALHLWHCQKRQLWCHRICVQMVCDRVSSTACQPGSPEALELLGGDHPQRQLAAWLQKGNMESKGLPPQHPASQLGVESQLFQEPDLSPGFFREVVPDLLNTNKAATACTIAASNKRSYTRLAANSSLTLTQQ